MESKNRIDEAQTNFKRYLVEGLLLKTNNKVALPILIKNSKESLKAAKILFDNKIYLWTIVSSYYSMFYIANAVLLNLGYKTNDQIVHKVTSDSLIVIVKDKLKNKLLEDYEEIQEEALNIAEIKTNELITSFEYERDKRGRIQYHTTEANIQNKAITSLKRAQEFIFELEKLI